MKSLMQEDHLASLIRGSLSLMCKTSLNYETEIEIKGLLGITVDKKEVFLVDVREFINIEPVEDSWSSKKSPVSENPVLKAALKRKITDKPGAERQKRSRRTETTDIKVAAQQEDDVESDDGQTSSPGPLSLSLDESTQLTDVPAIIKVERDSDDEEVDETERDDVSYGVDFDSLTQREIQADDAESVSAVRFAPLFNAEEIEEQDGAMNHLTRRHTSFAKNIFCEYLRELGKNPDDLDIIIQRDDLDSILEGFFLSIRNKKGGHYKSNSYLAIRFGLMRYCNSVGVDINQKKFEKSCKIFKTVLKKLKNSEVDHRPFHLSITDEDRQKMNLYFENAVDNPVGLQQYVWYCIVLHLSKRGREKQRELTKSSFTAHTVNGVTFLSQVSEEAMKSGEMSEREMSKTKVIPELKGSKLNPVVCYKNYVSRLNPNCDALFQKPKRQVIASSKGPWYYDSPIGKNSLCDMMKNISRMAELSQVYNSNSVKTTTVTTLHDVFYQKDLRSKFAAETGNQANVISVWQDATATPHNAAISIQPVSTMGRIFLANPAPAASGSNTVHSGATILCKLEPV